MEGRHAGGRGLVRGANYCCHAGGQVRLVGNLLEICGEGFFKEGGGEVAGERKSSSSPTN